MKVSEFAKSAGVSSDAIVAALNGIRASSDVKAKTEITEIEQGILLEKFPAVAGDSVWSDPNSPPVNEVILKNWEVYAVPGHPKLIIEADDESEAIRRYVLERGIRDTSAFNFRCNLAEEVEA